MRLFQKLLGDSVLNEFSILQMLLLFLDLLGTMCRPGGMNYGSHGAQTLLSVIL